MESKKKITFFLTSLVGGGAENVCVNLANGMSHKGWEIDLVVLNLNNADYLNRLSSKVKLNVLNVNHVSFSILQIAKYLIKNPPKKVLVFNYELTVALLFVRIFFFQKFKIIARNNTTLSQVRLKLRNKKSTVLRWLMNIIYFKVDHVINQCKSMEEDILSVYPRLKGKTNYIFNPVNFEVEQFSNAEKIIEKENFILFVGRLEKEKGVHFCINAFSKLIQYHPNLRLKIIGKGSQEDDLKDLAKKLNIYNKIDFDGFSNNLINEYCKAKVLILTSFFEGFPNVLLESITLGTPVVSFNCPSGPSEIIKDGINGYLVSHLSLDDLILKIKLALDTNFNSLVVKETADQFNNEKILSEYINILENI